MAANLPFVTLNILPAAVTVGDDPQKVLFVGQMVKNHPSTFNPVGTFTPAVGGSLVTDIQNDGTTDVLFGPKSMIAAMLREGRKINGVTRFDAIVVEDALTSAAVLSTLTFTGSVTGDGNVSLAIGSRTNHVFTDAFETGATVADISASFGGPPPGIINNSKTAPVTALNQGPGILELTATNRGLDAAKITVEILELPPGVSVTFTPFLPVGTDPDLTAIFDLIEQERYQTIVWPESYDQSLTVADSYKPLIDNLEIKFNFPNKLLDGVAIITFTNPFSLQKLQYESLDTQVISLFANKEVNETLFKGSALVELNYVQSAQVGALRALRFTKGADIARFVSATNGALDNFGGPQLASLPYFNTPFELLPVISPNTGYTLEEIAELVGVQASLLQNNNANTGIVALQFQTLSKTAGTATPNDSFRFLNFVDTISGVREFFFNNLKARFAQSRLTEGDLVRGVNMANVNSIKAFMGGLYQDLAGPEFVLVQAGAAAIRFFKTNLVVTVDLEKRLATVNAKVPIVTQLANIIGDVQIAFSVNN